MVSIVYVQFNWGFEVQPSYISLVQLFIGTLLHFFFLLHRYSLQLVSYTPMLLLVALYFIVPESSRWLIAQGKNEEAKENLSRRASFNK